MTKVKKITIEIDVAADFEIGEVMAMIQKQDGRIKKHIAIGVSGHPTLFIQFDHYVLAENFLMEYCGDTDVETYQV